MLFLRTFALALMLVACIGAAPDHIKTDVQDLCFQTKCYHPPTRVSLPFAAHYLTWAQPDGRDAARVRAAGIKITLYTDPNIQYAPNNYAPLLTNDEATFLRDCSGHRATIDDYQMTGYLMDFRSQRFVNVWDTYVDSVRSQFDALFVDDLFSAVQYWKEYKSAPCGLTRDAWSDATAALFRDTRAPIIFNNLAVHSGQSDDPRPDPLMHKALDFPNVIGGMYELCFTNDPRHKDGGAQWLRASNSQIYTITRHKLWFCFSEEDKPADTDSSRDARLYLYASFLLGYDFKYSVLRSSYTDPQEFNVDPETGLVPTQPKESAQDTIETLRSSGGTYVREFGACYFHGKPIGPCASAVNSDDNSTFSLNLSGYGHTVVLTGGGVAAGGRVTFNGPPPPTSLPPTTAIIAVR